MFKSLKCFSLRFRSSCGLLKIHKLQVFITSVDAADVATTADAAALLSQTDEKKR